MCGLSVPRQKEHELQMLRYIATRFKVNLFLDLNQVCVIKHKLLCLILCYGGDAVYLLGICAQHTCLFPVHLPR